MKKEPTLEQLVAFCTLMEGHGGIVTKAPSYIFEKWESCSERTSRDELLGLMDSTNATKYRDYITAWRVK
jgi:hypothetical protein